MGFPFWGGNLIKHLCKSILKKKLGDLILGDIDLDQLDVQLTKGVLHLSDLALNADFINQKLAGSAIMMKEGSLKSLTIKIPMKLNSCEIEVEQFEIVLAPFVTSETSHKDAGCLVSSDDAQQENVSDTQKVGHGIIHSNAGSVFRDVDEGVKRIANAVKWFLTSFHIRAKDVYIVFDPSAILDLRRAAYNRSLVLLIKEIEFGTCLSEEALIKLNNFVKFQEAVVEFLQMDDVDALLYGEAEANRNESHPGQSTTTMLTGPIGGFSGTLNLSIPWKNGSLNLESIAADVSIDSLELRVQPSSIQWIISIWGFLQSNPISQHNYVHEVPDTSSSISRLAPSSSIGVSAKLGADIVTENRDGLSNSLFGGSSQEKFEDTFFTRTHLIQNWVPESYDAEDIAVDSDYDSSIDHFFECYEEMRSSQMNSGNSGIWNWTCSVFSAINYASTLASGSDIVLTEQLTKKTLRASIEDICVVLCFSDENHFNHSDNVSNSLINGKNYESYMSCLSSMHPEQSAGTEANTVNLSMHHLEARFHNALLDLEAYPQNLKFNASIGSMKVDEYYSNKNCAAEFGFQYQNTFYDSILLCHDLRAKVQAALPATLFPPDNFESYDKDDEESAACSDTRNGLVRIELLKSIDKCICQYAASSTGSGGISTTSASVYVTLPPFILWIHFHLVYMLLDLLNQIECLIEKRKTRKEVAEFCERRDSSVLGESDKLTPTTAVSPEVTLTGNLIFSTARIILCLPSKFDRDFSHPSSLDKFVIFNHSPSFNLGEVSRIPPLQNERFCQGYPSAPSTTIYLDLNNFDIYWVESADTLDDGSCKLDKTFSAVKIISVTSRTTENNCGVTMIWQKGHGVGPWIASRAWSLATLHEKKITPKEIGKGPDFAFVTTLQDIQETSSSIRRELLLSTGFLLRIKFSSISTHLGKKDVKLFSDVISYVLDGLYNGRTATSENMMAFDTTPSNNGALQTSIFFECDILDVCIPLEEVVEVNHLLQTELEGSWTHLKLCIEKFELLSVSNIGGITDAGFSWINHGEGELWGTVTSGLDKPHEEKFLLIVCRNSASRRGDGDGTNVLSFGTAGSSVTHMWNPKLCQSYVSIVVSCGTVVAPGGRLDWISAICLLFSSPSQEDEQPRNDVMPSRPSDGSAVSRSSFFLDLVDVAMSYEPHIRSPVINGDITDMGPSWFFEAEDETHKRCVACLLAASSLSLSSHASSDSTSTDYNIRMRDLGLLICDSTGSENVSCGYHVNYLHQAGYVKVAENTLVEAVLGINPHMWKLKFLDSHFNIGTCHDTTRALICLISQLQQIYAPDMKDALDHLQSRWNTIQAANEESVSTDAFDRFEKSTNQKLPSSDEDSKSVGLLDEILENAFYMNEESTPSSDSSTQCSLSADGFKLEDGHMAGTSTPKINDVHATRGSFGRLLDSDGEEQHDYCLPLIIDTYCAPDLLSPSPSSLSSHSHNEGHACRLDDDACRHVDHPTGVWYNNGSLVIVENHIPQIDSQQAEKQSTQERFGFDSPDPSESCNVKGKALLQNIDVRWRMYAGDDWSKPWKNLSCSSNSAGRDGSSCLELSISGLNLEYDMYPDGDVRVSKLSLSACDINLFDRSKDAPWKMVLGQYHSKKFPRESCSKAIRLELEAVRPELLTPLEDYRLHLELLPLRLHLDQRQLNFLVSFFSNDSFNDPCLPPDLDEPEMSERGGRTSFGSPTMAEEALLPFFQKFDMRPLVIRVDYIPRQFDPLSLSKGNYAELLNLVPWKGIDLKLKKVSAAGVYGWNNILETVVGEWLEDISHNQVHNLLKGLAPIRSAVAVSSGTSKLISLPMKSYKKDGKLLKGMQRGAVAFIRSITIEAVGLGVHLAAGAHEILLKTEFMLTTIPPPVPLTEVNRRKENIRSNQPEGAQQGFQQAYESLTEGFGRSASALFTAPLKAYQRGAGVGSALATALRAAPAAALAPVSASARAWHYALLGLRNSLDPEHKRESKQKYLG